MAGGNPASGEGSLSPAIAEAHPLRQLHVIVTPWPSGHCTVDLIVRAYSGASHWNRRSGHLDLDVHPSELSGLTAAAVLRLLADGLDVPKVDLG